MQKQKNLKKILYMLYLAGEYKRREKNNKEHKRNTQKKEEGKKS
jgi:hypothetical protein